MKRNKPYKFSVIMPIYRVEAYLAEAIDSVIAQSIGFRENIQIILVNDGSPDRCDIIAKSYQKQYPDNIIYIEKENGGVSSARNVGMRYIEGEYINFLDPDDKWEKNAFEKAYEFLEKYVDEIDIVAARPRYFGLRSDFGTFHDYKFTGDRIVDIETEYSAVQMSVSSIFIRRKALEHLSFDTRLTISEDSIFVAKIIFNKRKYAALKSLIYYYRKRETKDSTLDLRRKNKSWFFNTPKYCYQGIFQYSKEAFGKIIPYAQYHVMCDLCFHLKNELPQSFTIEEKDNYKESIVQLLQEIDDKIIWEQRNFELEYKRFTLGLKYGENVIKNALLKKGNFLYHGKTVFSLQNDIFKINILEIREDNLWISGETTLSQLGDRCKIFIFKNKDIKYPVKWFSMHYKDKKAFNGEFVLRGEGFTALIPMSYKYQKLKIIAEIDGKERVLLPVFGEWGKLNEKQKYSYYVNGNWLVKYEKPWIKCMKNRLRVHAASEFRYMREIMDCTERKEVVYDRCLYYLIKMFSRKPIWLLQNVAVDHPEEEFINCFIKKGKKQKANIYFLYFSDDKKQSLEAGETATDCGTRQHKLRFLLADKVISSEAKMWFSILFEEDKEYFKDLYKSNFVYWQRAEVREKAHVVHKQRKNISLFLTYSYEEAEKAVKDYGYTEKQVKVINGRYKYEIEEIIQTIKNLEPHI